MRSALAAIPFTPREIAGIAVGFAMAFAGLGIALAVLASHLPPIGAPL